jgi:hypothetical protein
MKLLPERHPVRDFFVLDVLDVAPRFGMASMAHPVFSLSTKPETRILRYENDGVIVEIHPSAKALSAIFGKDVPIYCVSKLMHMKNQGQEIGPTVGITTHDLLVSTNRLTGGIFYERLEHTTQNFGLIEWYDYNRKGSGFAERLRYLDIKLPDWLFPAIEEAEVLPLNRDYFRGIAPRRDKCFLQHYYIAWAKDLEPARNEDARFLGWVRSFTKGPA